MCGQQLAQVCLLQVEEDDCHSLIVQQKPKTRQEGLQPCKGSKKCIAKSTAMGALIDLDEEGKTSANMAVIVLTSSLQTGQLLLPPAHASMCW
jgi:hypothetical protein